MKPHSIINSIYLLGVASTLILLGGCAKFFNPVGENTYDCNRKENPNSPYCHSFRSVDQATSVDVPDSRYDQNMSIAEMDRLTGIAPVGESNTSKRTTKSNNKTGTVYTTSQANESQITARQNKEVPIFGHENTATPDGSPVRVGPVVQRVWIKSFADSNDMLTSDQVVYKEIEPTHWAGQRSTKNTIQGKSSARLSGAYPHRPAEASEDLQAGTATTQGETFNNSGNDNFSQPGAQRRAGETASPLPDSGGLTMPN